MSTAGVLSVNNLSFLNAGNQHVTMTATSDGVCTMSSNSGNVLLKGLTNPIDPQDGVTKSYADALAQGAINGISWKEPAVALADTNGPLATAYAAGQSIDGRVLALGERIVLTAQTPIENGIWVVTAGAPTRPDDFASASTQTGSAILITEGSTYGDTQWVLSTDPSIIVDTDAQLWVQLSGTGSINAGAALSKTGSTLDVNVDDSTIEIITDALQVKDAGITNAKLANDSITVTAGDGLQTGGSAALGSSVTLDVDATVVRTSGDQTISGVKTFTENVFALGFNASSDERLKKDIIAVEDSENIMLLNPVYYKWNEKAQGDNHKHCGFIAQEVQYHFPEAVHERADGLLTVDYNYLFCLMFHQMQEMRLKLDKQ